MHLTGDPDLLRDDAIGPSADDIFAGVIAEDLDCQLDLDTRGWPAEMRALGRAVLDHRRATARSPS